MNIEISKKVFSERFYPLLDNKDRYLLLYGGRDSGKSHFATQKSILDCLRLPYFRCILVKKTYESIKDSQWQSIKDLIHEWNLEHLFKFKTSPLEIECVNGNKFIARGCDKPEKLKSIKDPSHVWYEEGNQLTYEDFITITSTIRSTQAEYLQEILSFNPEHDGELETFWIYKHFFRGRQEKSFSDSLDIEIDGEKSSMPFTVHHSTYLDNPYCTPERKVILEGLKETSPYYYNVFTKGEWGVKEVEQPYITAFEEEKHVKEIEPNFKRQLIFSFDFNIDNTSVVVGQVGNDYIHLLDELTANDLPALCDKIKFKYGKHLASCYITGDRSGQNRTHLISDNMNSYRLIKNRLNLSSRQFKILVNPPHKDNRVTCNTLLAFHPNFYIHPRCKETIFDLKFVECDQDGKIIKKNRTVSNQKADKLDCFRYLLNTFKKKWVKNYRYD